MIMRYFTSADEPSTVGIMNASETPNYAPAGFCPACDYPMGIGTCPECGQLVSRPERRPRRARLRRRISRIAIGAASVSVLAIGFTKREYLARIFWPTGHLLELKSSCAWGVSWTEWAGDVLRTRKAIAQSREQAALEARRARIEAELVRIGPHPWAGVYRAGDDWHYEASLWVAPDSGVVFDAGGCVGGGEWSVINHGDVVEVTADRIRFAPRVDPRLGSTSDELVIVHWGSHTLLVFSNDFIDFCNSVNSGQGARGAFTRDEYGGLNYASAPTVPEEYRKYLLGHEIEAGVIQQSTRKSYAPHESGSWDPVHELIVTLDRGAADGLQPEMLLYPITRADDGDHFVEARILSVERNSAVATTNLHYEMDRPVPNHVGRRYSSRDRRFEK